MRTVLLTPIILLLLLAAVYLLTPQAELELEPTHGGYLDAHAPLVGIGAGGSGCYVHPDLLGSLRFRLYLHGMGVTRDELKEHGDALIARRLSRMISTSGHINRAVLLALDGVVHDDDLDRAATLVYVPNDFAARMAERYPNLEFGASINPDRSDWRRRLTQAARRGAVLVRWLPALMNIDPADPRYRDFYRQLVELDLPLLVHVGEHGAAGDRANQLGDPSRLALALDTGVTVIAAHAGAGGAYRGRPSHQRLLSMLAEYPNLYIDISGLTQINKIGYLVEILESAGAGERMLYGSNWPLLFFPMVSGFYHWPDVDLSVAKTIHHVDGRLDRDVLLKRALGVPDAAFARSEKLLLR
ncbi:MAG TPA: amidohydrolase family protein [Arenicellales bacterium]|nr:amidohydrolase family protein [Arenicellales bacterium]